MCGSGCLGPRESPPLWVGSTQPPFLPPPLGLPCPHPGHRLPSGEACPPRTVQRGGSARPTSLGGNQTPLPPMPLWVGLGWGVGGSQTQASRAQGPTLPALSVCASSVCGKLQSLQTAPWNLHRAGRVLLPSAGGASCTQRAPVGGAFGTRPLPPASRAVTFQPSPCKWPVYGGGGLEKPRSLFIKHRVLTLTCLNFSHLQGLSVGCHAPSRLFSTQHRV